MGNVRSKFLNNFTLSDFNSKIKWVSTDRFLGPDHRLYLLFDLTLLTLVIPILKKYHCSLRVLFRSLRVLNRSL